MKYLEKKSILNRKREEVEKGNIKPYDMHVLHQPTITTTTTATTKVLTTIHI